MSDVGVDSNPYDSSDGGNELSWMLIWGAFGYAITQLFKPKTKPVNPFSVPVSYNSISPTAISQSESVTVQVVPMLELPSAIVSIMEPMAPLVMYGGYEGDIFYNFKSMSMLTTEIQNTRVSNFFNNDLINKTSIRLVADINEDKVSVNTSSFVMSSAGTGSICIPGQCMQVWPSNTPDPSADFKFASSMIKAIGFAISLRTRVKLFEEGEDFDEF